MASWPTLQNSVIGHLWRNIDKRWTYGIVHPSSCPNHTEKSWIREWISSSHCLLKHWHDEPAKQDNDKNKNKGQNITHVVPLDTCWFSLLFHLLEHPGRCRNFSKAKYTNVNQKMDGIDASNTTNARDPQPDESSARREKYRVEYVICWRPINDVTKIILYLWSPFSFEILQALINRFLITLKRIFCIMDISSKKYWY